MEYGSQNYRLADLHDGIRKRYGRDAVATGELFSFVAWCISNLDAKAALKDAKSAWQHDEYRACLSAVERACEQSSAEDLCHLFPVEEFVSRVVANCG